VGLRILWDTERGCSAWRCHDISFYC